MKLTNNRRKRRSRQGASNVFISRKHREAQVLFKEERRLQRRKDDLKQEKQSLNERLAQAAERIRDFQVNIPFDPLDPVALLKASKNAALNPHMSAYHSFKPHVETIEEERMVPVSYDWRKELENQSRKLLEQTMLEKKKQHLSAVLVSRKNESQAGTDLLAGIESRSLMEERNQQQLICKVSADHHQLLLKELSKLDPHMQGMVDKTTLKKVLMENMHAMKLNHADVDKLLMAMVGDDDRIDYTNIGRKKEILGGMSMKNNASAPALLQSTMPISPTRHHPVQYTNTKHLLRPLTGSVAFFPESQRFSSSQTINDRDKATLLLNKKKTLLEQVGKRFKALQEKNDSKFWSQQEEKLKSLISQRERYLEPIEKQKEHDIQVAMRGTGVKRFKDNYSNMHQIQNLLGASDSRMAYEVYEARTGTVEWMQVFNIKNSMYNKISPK